jgi:hypothetical protein
MNLTSLSSLSNLTSSQNSHIQIPEEDYSDFVLSDYDDSFETNEWLYIIPVVIIVFTFFIGFIGNILVVFSVIYSEKLNKNVTFQFLASLSTVNLLLIVLCLPIKVYPIEKVYF